VCSAPDTASEFLVHANWTIHLTHQPFHSIQTDPVIIIKILVHKQTPCLISLNRIKFRRLTKELSANKEYTESTLFFSSKLPRTIRKIATWTVAKVVYQSAEQKPQSDNLVVRFASYEANRITFLPSRQALYTRNLFNQRKM